MRRELFIAGTISSALAACWPIGTALNRNEHFQNILKSGEFVSYKLIGTHGLAKEYRDSDIDRQFRVNGLATPNDAYYTGPLSSQFHNYRMVVDGAVEKRHVSR